MGAVRKDEPLEKSSSLVASVVVAMDVSIVTLACRTFRLTVLSGVHLSLLGLWLLDGLEKFCVDALSARLLCGAEYSSAQLLVVRLFAACACAFCHCELWCRR